MRKNLVFFGHHKCGSRYFRAYILREIARVAKVPFYQYEIASPVYEFDQPDFLDLDNVRFERLSRERCILGLTNSSQPVVERVLECDQDFIGVHVRRDPRQFLVSAYYHHLDGHPVETETWRWPKLESDRVKLNSMNVEDGLIFEMDNIAGDIIDRQFRAWIFRPEIIEIKLEELDLHLAELMHDLNRALGLSIDTLKPNREMRQANPIAKDWRSVFTPRVTSEFNHRFGDVLERWGYSSDSYNQ